MLCGVEVVWILLFVLVMGAMWWFAYHLEPHYSSKDGRRFLCTAQEMEGGEPLGRVRETRVLVLPDGLLEISQKRMMRRKHSCWVIVGKSPNPPKKMQVYLAQLRADGQKIPSFIALRLPAKSRCVPVLDELVERERLRATTSRRAPGTAAPVAPPDPD